MGLGGTAGPNEDVAGLVGMCAAPMVWLGLGGTAGGKGKVTGLTGVMAVGGVGSGRRDADLVKEVGDKETL